MTVTKSKSQQGRMSKNKGSGVSPLAWEGVYTDSQLRRLDRMIDLPPYKKVNLEPLEYWKNDKD